jgi:hypothetical protein
MLRKLSPILPLFGLALMSSLMATALGAVMAVTLLP